MFQRLSVRRVFFFILIISIVQLFILGIIFNVVDFLPIQRLAGKPLESGKNHRCNITDSHVIKTLKRMKDPECRRRGIDVYCQIQSRQAWPETLESSCDHFDKDSFGKPLSCHSFGPETLEQLTQKNRKSYKVFQSLNLGSRLCSDLCLMIDFRFALYQRQNDYCICCDDLKWITESSDQSNIPKECDFNCESKQNCSSDVIYVFSTGLKKVPYFLPGLDTIRDDQKNYVRPKIVFLLLVNGRAVHQVNRLLKNIYYPHHYYFIHVDSRNNYLFGKLLYLEEKYSNVALARNRSAPIWGAANLLTAILNSIGGIFRRWPNDWDFVLNLSETDFPIKQIDELERYLGHNYGRNFVKSHGKNTHDFVQTQALNRVFFQCEDRMWRMANRSLIKGIVWDGGSDWFILDRNFSRFLISSNDSVVNGLLQFFQYSLLPAESFFHVVLRNTRYCSTIVNNNLKATNWNRKQGCRCQHRHIVDWCGCSPNVFRLKDIPRLMATQTKPLFFARKFDPTVDGEIIDFVELRFLANNFQLEDINEKLFLLNNYDYRFDQYPTGEWRMEFYNFFIQKTLKLIQKMCKENMELIKTKIQEVNIVFKANQFFGTLIRFGDGGENKSTEAEVLLRRFSNDTILFWKETKPRLKSIQACSDFDEKEEIFRNYECLLNEGEPFQVHHQWEVFFGSYQIEFLFLDGQNQFRYRAGITVNNSQTDATVIRFLFQHNLENFSPEPGLWKLVILNSENFILGVHRFLILANNAKQNETYRKNQEKKESIDKNLRHTIDELIAMNKAFFAPTAPEMETIWFVDRICLDVTENSECSTLKSCRHHEANWSSWHQSRRWIS